jgi:hypothetical protein
MPDRLAAAIRGSLQLSSCVQSWTQLERARVTPGPISATVVPRAHLIQVGAFASEPRRKAWQLRSQFVLCYKRYDFPREQPHVRTRAHMRESPTVS